MKGRKSEQHRNDLPVTSITAHLPPRASNVACVTLGHSTSMTMLLTPYRHTYDIDITGVLGTSSFTACLGFCRCPIVMTELADTAYSKQCKSIIVSLYLLMYIFENFLCMT